MDTPAAISRSSHQSLGHDGQSAEQSGFVLTAKLVLPQSAAARRWSARGLRQGLALERSGRVDAAGALGAARTQIREPSGQFCFVPTAEFVFPNTNYPPAASAQGAVYAAVAGPVAFDLGFPEFRAGLGPGGVLRPAVPEAAVHKDGGLQFRKDKVGFDPERLQLRTSNFPLERSSSSLPRDAIRPENLDQPQLGGPLLPWSVTC